MAWQNIAASETDAESPLTQTLFDKIRGNLTFLYSRKIVLTDPPASLTTTFTTSWTDLTISSGSDTPEFAIVQLEVKVGPESISSGSRYARVELRKKDTTTWSNYPMAEARTYLNSGQGAEAMGHNLAIVPVDYYKRFQYRCATNASNKAVKIVQIGYVAE